jgi:hypothetical protein
VRTKIFIVFAVGLAIACQAMAETVWIDSVDVMPIQPINTDLITFNIAGGAVTASSWVEYDQCQQNGTSLQLNLYVDRGSFQTVSNWSYSKQIQPLLTGTYALEVRAFDNSSGPYYGTLQDTYNVDFTVTPGPSTFAIFGFALPIFRVFQKRKLQS